MCGFVKNHLGRLAPSKRLSLDEDSLKIQVKKKVERLPSFRFHYSTARGELFAEGTQRGSDACPLHLLCKCGVPAYRSRAVEQLTLAVAPVKFWRKGLLRFWLAAGFYTKVVLHLTAVLKVEISTLSPIL